MMNEETKLKKRRMRRVGEKPAIDLSAVMPETKVANGTASTGALTESITEPKLKPPEPVVCQDANGRKIALNPVTGWVDVQLPSGQRVSGVVTKTDLKNKDGSLVDAEKFPKEGYFYATIGGAMLPMPASLMPQFLALYKAPNGLLCAK